MGVSRKVRDVITAICIFWINCIIEMVLVYIVQKQIIITLFKRIERVIIRLKVEK